MCVCVRVCVYVCVCVSECVTAVSHTRRHLIRVIVHSCVIVYRVVVTRCLSHYLPPFLRCRVGPHSRALRTHTFAETTQRTETNLRRAKVPPGCGCAEFQLGFWWEGIVTY